MSQPRPSPDALLERIKAQDRARLRICVGAAPGVGKTYQMLQEAHALRARGLDVVIGSVETYGRRETDVPIKDLEIVPQGAGTPSGIWTSSISSTPAFTS
jgi:two-component system sensor histidine kinase KdpD